MPVLKPKPSDAKNAPAEALDPVAAAHAGVDAIEGRITATKADIEAAEASLKEAAADLADPSDTGAEERFTTATGALATLQARLESLNAKALPAAHDKLASAQAEAAEIGRMARYLQAEDLRKSAIKALEREYPEVGRRLVELLAVVNHARQAVLTANANLPEHCVPLVEPEALVRDQRPRSRQIVRENVERRWVFDDSGHVLNDDQVTRVRALDADRGVLNTGSSNKITVHRAPFRRVEYVPEIPWRGGPRLAGMLIPGLRAGEPDFWRGDDRLGPQAIAALIAAKNDAPAGPAPALMVEFIPCDAGAVATSEPGRQRTAA